MTKLNLSALKKKADILANPPSEVSPHNLQTNSVSTILQDIPQTPTVSSSSSDTSASQLWTQPSTITTDTSTVKEFFPNLNLSDDLFDDIFAKKEIIIAEETPQMHEVQSITPDTGVSDLITPTDGTPSETVAPFPTPVTEVFEADISIVEWAMSEVSSVLESVATPIEQQEYVKSVAEDLSLEREGGLTRFSRSKKAAIFGLLGLSLVWIIGGGLYVFDIFPPTKTSVVEAPPIVENNIPTPVTVVEQTGSLSNTGASTSTWTALPVLTQSGTVETLSGSTLSGSTLLEVTLSWATHLGTTTTGSTLSGASLTGVALSGSILSGATVTGSTLSGSTLSGSTSSGTVLTKPIPPANSTASVTGSSSIIRTPNIRVPLTNTGTLR